MERKKNLISHICRSVLLESPDKAKNLEPAGPWTPLAVLTGLASLCMKTWNDLSWVSHHLRGTLFPSHPKRCPLAVAGRMVVPKDVHILIFMPFEYIPLHGKRKFASVIQVRTLRWGGYPRFSGWDYPNVNISSVQSLRHGWLFATPWIAACQASVQHQLPEFTQTHVHRVSDVIQPSHPLSSPSPPAPNPSQHQGLFQWVNSLHEAAKVLEFQLQHQSFQWTPRTDFL